MSFVNYKGYTREIALKSVGAGWAPLVNRIFDKLDSIQGVVKIIQVKEKYAGLRVYTDYDNEELQKVINDAEHQSFKMCEVCGQPGKVRGKAWYYTSCDKHAEDGDTPHTFQPGDPYVEDHEEERI
jgi:hypothetical protein